MPQAKRGGSSSGSSSPRSGTTNRSASGTTKRSASSSSRGGSRASGTRSSGAQTRGAGSSSAAQSTPAGDAADARLEAVAQRLRKLNERIIEAGKGAGEVTLTSYEKALKSIASTLERGPGSSDVEWVSNLATAQAKFIRDVTTAWTSAARDILK
jgi:hypothetical protein